MRINEFRGGCGVARGLRATALCALLGLLAASNPAMAQASSAPKKPSPQTAAVGQLPRGADGHPDLTGLWTAGVKDFVGQGENVVAPLTPAYAERRAQWQAAANAGHPLADSVTQCEAFGTPRLMSYGVFEIVQKPKELWVITEVLHEVRRVYLDGRPHPDADADHTFDGYATGHWEGDTLVIDTDHIRANVLDQTGLPNSDQLKVVERIRMSGPNAIDNEMTLTDPLAYTHPWTVTQHYRRLPPRSELEEYICTENNRNPTDDQGRTLAR